VFKLIDLFQSCENDIQEINVEYKNEVFDEIDEILYEKFKNCEIVKWWIDKDMNLCVRLK
jgi:hypothetical protein